MAGDPLNASIWTDADVYIALDLDEPNPADADTAFAGNWDLVGLLDGEAGFTMSREETVTDHTAWGAGVIRTSRTDFAERHSFTALEDNATVRELLYPGSTDSALYVPRPTRVKIAFETREGGKVERLISKLAAEVALDGEVSKSESDLTRYPFVATIFADGGTPPQLWVRQFTSGSSS